MTSAAGGASSSRIPSLTGMRFIAALLVFVFHAASFNVFTNEPLDHSFENATNTMSFMGVSFFFILSGFVLTWSHRPADTARLFWRRRICKIYPNQVVTWGVTLLLMVWLGQSIAAGPTILNLFLLHSWAPNQTLLSSVDPVSWSLSCEVFFYLSFPVLLWLVRKIRPQHLWLGATIVVAAIFLVPQAARLLPSTPPVGFGQPGSIPQWWFVYFFPPVRALEFVLGMVMAQIVRHGRWIHVGLVPAALLAVAGYLLSHHVPYYYSLVAVTVIPLALLIAATAQADIAHTWSPLRNRVMIFLGDVSYAFYLVHYLVIYYGDLALGHVMFGTFPLPTRTWSTWAGIGMILAFLAVSILAASALYLLVERPVMNRWSRPRPRVAASPAAQPISSLPD